MTTKTAELLAKGLKSGFGGGNVMKNVKRAKFNFDSSHLENGSNVYHDEWIAGTKGFGGGQEIVETNGQRYTRVYAGGTVYPSILKKLAITETQVMGYLKDQIIENGHKIRLFKSFSPRLTSPWKYEYKVDKKTSELPITTGTERIYYKNKLVFQHNFIICPVE